MHIVRQYVGCTWTMIKINNLSCVRCYMCVYKTSATDMNMLTISIYWFFFHSARLEFLLRVCSVVRPDTGRQRSHGSLRCTGYPSGGPRSEPGSERRQGINTKILSLFGKVFIFGAQLKCLINYYIAWGKTVHFNGRKRSPRKLRCVTEVRDQNQDQSGVQTRGFTIWQ